MIHFVFRSCYFVAILQQNELFFLSKDFIATVPVGLTADLYNHEFTIMKKIQKCHKNKKRKINVTITQNENIHKYLQIFKFGCLPNKSTVDA